MPSFILLLVLPVTGLIVLNIFYNLFLHPLSHVPGPFLSRISSLPSFYHALKGDRHIWLWQTFEQYGDKIRTGPNVVLFKSTEAFRAIYDPRANFKRSTAYHCFTRNSNDFNTLTTTDVRAHARRRRLLQLAFTDRSIKAAESFVVRHVDRWIELLVNKGTDWSQPEDVSTMLDYVVFDILGDLCFGRDFQTKERNDNRLMAIPHLITKYMAFQYPITKFPLRSLILWLKPRGLNQLMGACTPKHIQEFYTFVRESVDQRFETYKIQEALANKETVNEKIKAREDMFYFLCSAKDPETKLPAFDKHDLLAEARLLLIAGVDTTSTTLSSIFFYLVNNSHVYEKLTTEIRSTFQSPDDIVQGPKLQSCKYLQAVIAESMRMTPAGPSEPERVIRAGGATIDGEFYPSGTTVGIPQWAYYHNEDLFNDPWKFQPERWIESPENPIEDIHAIKRVYSPFNKGANSCVGQNLANLVVSMVVARTLWRAECRIAPGTNVGAGGKHLGWGRRNANVYQVQDAFVSLREGPVAQFRVRG